MVISVDTSGLFEPSRVTLWDCFGVPLTPHSDIVKVLDVAPEQRTDSAPICIKRGYDKAVKSLSTVIVIGAVSLCSMDVLHWVKVTLVDRPPHLPKITCGSVLPPILEDVSWIDTG